MRKSLLKTIVIKDDLSEIEAQELINEARDDLEKRLANGEMPFDICEEYFGLEADYLDDLIEV